jgi:hypothetical protein
MTCHLHRRNVYFEKQRRCTTMMRLWIPLLAPILLITACSQPTKEELLESQEAKRQYCDDMLADIKSNKDRPLIRATLQENYNRECLGQSYPDEVQ